MGHGCHGCHGCMERNLVVKYGAYPQIVGSIPAVLSLYPFNVFMHGIPSIIATWSPLFQEQLIFFQLIQYLLEAAHTRSRRWVLRQSRSLQD